MAKYVLAADDKRTMCGPRPSDCNLNHTAWALCDEDSRLFAMTGCRDRWVSAFAAADHAEQVAHRGNISALRGSIAQGADALVHAPLQLTPAGKGATELKEVPST